MERALGKCLTPGRRQWAWFAVLWCGGLGSVTLLGYAVRLAMGIE